MKQPRIEAEAVFGEAAIAVTELCVEQELRREFLRRSLDRGVGVPDRSAAYASKAASRRTQMRFENGINSLSELEVRISYDPSADAGRTIAAARAHRGNAVDELRLADRREIGVAVGAIHRVALDEDARPDIVARADVMEILAEQIARAVIPEVMVRIDDRQFRLKDRFFMFGEPLGIESEQRPASLRFGLRSAHRNSPHGSTSLRGRATCARRQGASWGALPYRSRPATRHGSGQPDPLSLDHAFAVDAVDCVGSPQDDARDRRAHRDYGWTIGAG